MATISSNRDVWDERYDWSLCGEEWSRHWVTSTMQWYGTLLPRIHRFLPASSILEIAPGFGRWTHFLKDNCDRLAIVDLSSKCIDACRERFSDCSHIQYHVNDGKSLAMIPEQSVDFVFSFDSLVHADDKVMSAYISQVSEKLTADGVAFIHHSNLGQYRLHHRLQTAFSRVPKLMAVVKSLGLLEDVLGQWRDPTMTAGKMRAYAAENCLQCILQEAINWSTKRLAIDCISTVVRRDSKWSRDLKVFKNLRFMEEAIILGKVATAYDVHLQ